MMPKTHSRHTCRHARHQEGSHSYFPPPFYPNCKCVIWSAVGKNLFALLLKFKRTLSSCRLKERKVLPANISCHQLLIVFIDASQSDSAAQTGSPARQQLNNILWWRQFSCANNARNFTAADMYRANISRSENMISLLCSPCCTQCSHTVCAHTNRHTLIHMALNNNWSANSVLWLLPLFVLFY